VGFDDGPTNRKAHSHPVGFCRKERLENSLQVLRIYPGPEVFDGYQNAGNIVNIGPYLYQASTFGGGAHCLRRIQDQVQKYLLYLDPIGHDFGEALGQFRRDGYTLSTQIGVDYGKNIPDELVQVYQLIFVTALFEHRADASDHLARALAGGGNLP
jgi:hypothetical protein